MHSRFVEEMRMTRMTFFVLRLKQYLVLKLKRKQQQRTIRLDALVGMGFDSTKARQALDATDGRLDDAVAISPLWERKAWTERPAKEEIGH